MVRAPLAHLHTIQAHTFGQRKWNKSWCYWGISWMHLASPHRLSIIFMHIFVWFITIFGLEAFTRAWIPIVIVFFTFCNGSLWLAHHRKKLKPLGTHTHPDPPPPTQYHPFLPYIVSYTFWHNVIWTSTTLYLNISCYAFTWMHMGLTHLHKL
jgi:hypothetical protein